MNFRRERRTDRDEALMMKKICIQQIMQIKEWPKNRSFFARFWSQDFLTELSLKWRLMMRSQWQKFQVEVAVSSKDMGGQNSLSHHLVQSMNFMPISYPEVFLVASNDSEIRFSKWLTQNGSPCI